MEHTTDFLIILNDYLDDFYYSDDDDEDDSGDEEGISTIQRFPIKKRKREDRRGRHDKEYRARRKERIRSMYDIIISSGRDACIECGSTEMAVDGTVCQSCGLVSDRQRIADNPPIHSGLRSLVVYKPRFYIKERINNWRGICPHIQRQELCSILSELSKKQPRHISDITRSVIYDAVNKLWGNSPENRKKLVNRERWVWIKKFIAERPNIFGLEGSQEYLDRFNQTYPSEQLIFRLEKLISVLEEFFPDQLYSKKRNGIKRHNRPSRDIVILYLLYGIHPALSTLYKIDYWQPLTTKKALEDNDKRVRILLENARNGYPRLKWPNEEITLEQILEFPPVTISMLDLDYDTFVCFPYYYQNCIEFPITIK